MTAENDERGIFPGAGAEAMYLPTSPDGSPTTDHSPVPVSPALSTLNCGDSSFPCSPAPVSPSVSVTSAVNASVAVVTATQLPNVSLLQSLGVWDGGRGGTG